MSKLPIEYLRHIRLVAVEVFGDGKALFPTGFVKFFAEYARFRLQNLPHQSKKWQFPSFKGLHRNKSIYDECEFINSSISPDMTKDDLINNEVLKRAIVRSLEIIGEATKKIPADIKEQWSDVPWRNIAGMRDKLIHDYIGINYAIIWDVVRNKIPAITPIIAQIIKGESNT